MRSIARRDGRFFVRDQGSTVPVVVNGRPIGKGHDHPLAAGDELRIAGYVLRVDAPAPPSHDVSEDDTTTILREGTLLSWSEDGKAVPQDRISTVIVLSPEAPAAGRRRAAAPPPPRRRRPPHPRPRLPPPARMRRRGRPRRAATNCWRRCCAAPACAISRSPAA